jgi:hypothetical protein
MNKGITEVFVNPDKKELRDTAKGCGYIRYLADFNNKKLYVWDASQATHQLVIDNMKIHATKHIRSGGTLNSAGRIQLDTMYTQVSLHGINDKDVKKAAWLAKYVDITNLLTGLKEQ